MKEALFYEKLLGERVLCLLCPHSCNIKEGDVGICRVRRNEQGLLYVTNYAKTVTINIDPIEKKPLYHFYPNSSILSLGSNSCNLSCDFCQNYTISQMESETIVITPEQLLKLCRQKNIDSVAYTYTEPITWYEYVLESAKLLKENGIKTVLISNGYINEKPLLHLLPYIDAMNIDLKGMSDTFYQNLCKGTLQPVLESIKIAAANCHLEVTNLLIPKQNDSIDDLNKLTDFIADVNKDIPVHFSRYYPQYQRDTEPTSYTTLQTAYEIAKRKLSYVYLGNILTETETNTYCPNCNTLLIERNSFNAHIFNLKGNKCANCSHQIYGQFNPT
ncbi:MAG: AmmeMemoRadiSam system radical SAM enzyme [Candidatus Cloacimonadia bacterium]